MFSTSKIGNMEIEGEKYIKHLLYAKRCANFIVKWFHVLLQKFWLGHLCLSIIAPLNGAAVGIRSQIHLPLGLCSLSFVLLLKSDSRKFLLKTSENSMICYFVHECNVAVYHHSINFKSKFSKSWFRNPLFGIIKF